MSRLLGIVSRDGISQEQTHSCRREPWLLAHDGTIDQPSALFDFLLARLASHPSTASSRFVADMTLARAIEDLSSIPSLGGATFLLSDGEALYACCQGRPLFLLVRRLDPQAEAILVSSEPVPPKERWTTLAEGTLVVVWRRPRLGWAVMRTRSGA